MKLGDIETTEGDYKYAEQKIAQIVSKIINFKVPKSKKEKLGIAIAIEAPSDLIDRVENDLVKDLKMKINSMPGSVFDIVNLSQAMAQKINSAETARRYLDRSKCQLIIYGSLRERETDKYIFRLNGLVKHDAIPQDISNLFSIEFRGMLPEKLWFIKNEEIAGFDFTKLLLFTAARFITATAKYLSGEFELAYKLLKDLNKELSREKYARQDFLNGVRSQIKLRLADIVNSILIKKYYQFVYSRNLSSLKDMEPWLVELESLAAGTYSGHQLRSIFLYKIKGNIDEAIKELERIKNEHDRTWRYSLAFLYALQGDLKKARYNYKEANRYGVPFTAVIECEIFIDEELTKDISKVQLYFLLGYINFTVKLDYELAINDFKKFIKEADQTKYRPEIELARNYIKDCEDSLTRNNL